MDKLHIIMSRESNNSSIKITLFVKIMITHKEITHDEFVDLKNSHIFFLFYLFDKYILHLVLCWLTNDQDKNFLLQNV